MRKKLAELEKLSRLLEPGENTRRDMLGQVANYAESFLARLPNSKTYVKDEGRKGFPEPHFEDEPAEMAELIEFLRREVDTTGISPGSGGQLGYIPGGGLYPSALGDYLADISNRYSGLSFSGPGSARMEGVLVEWMCELAGYPQSAAGDLTSGGSIATLSALVTARDAHGISSGVIPDSCVYLTGQAHHCIDKALHVAGLADARKRIVAMDDRYRMVVAELERMISEDRARGLKPWLAVASAGTTDTGAVDPIPEIAAIAGQHGLWFHLDAAYGGFFLLCEEGRERLAGFSLADSIVIDPHKGLSLPYGSGAVLVRDGQLLARSHAYYADYMQDAKQPGHGPGVDFSPSEYSMELTRPFRGPRMWLPLKLFGLRPFKASLSEKIWLARYFYDEVSRLDGFETGPYPDLSIATFRYCPKDGDANAFNQALLAAVHADGKVFITSTMIGDVFTLRLAVLNFRTHRDTIDYLLNLLQEKARELEGGAL